MHDLCLQISDTKGTDGHYVDVGTQTHSFRTAPFRRTTTLEEVTAGGPAKLRLQLQAGSVSSRHNKATSAFTFSCGHSFHRSEFPRHFRSVPLPLNRPVGSCQRYMLPGVNAAS